MCDCKGRVSACGCRSARPGGFQPAPFPVTFPSRLQGEDARRHPTSGTEPRHAPVPVATKAVQVPQPARGVGTDRRNPDPWHTHEANWGSRDRLRWGMFVSSPTTARLAIAPKLPETHELRPMVGTPRKRRTNYPALIDPTYSFGKVTEADLERLSRERAAAVAKARRG